MYSIVSPVPLHSTFASPTVGVLGWLIPLLLPLMILVPRNTVLYYAPHPPELCTWGYVHCYSDSNLVAPTDVVVVVVGPKWPGVPRWNQMYKILETPLLRFRSHATARWSLKRASSAPSLYILMRLVKVHPNVVRFTMASATRPSTATVLGFWSSSSAERTPELTNEWMDGLYKAKKVRLAK